jgi:hypothetical protein
LSPSAAKYGNRLTGGYALGLGLDAVLMIAAVGVAMIALRYRSARNGQVMLVSTQSPYAAAE